MSDASRKIAAHELARLLVAARAHVSVAPPRTCIACGVQNPHPSRLDPDRCWRCGVVPP